MRAWLYYLGYSLRRQARARLLVVVSLGLLGLVAFLVHLNTRFDRWSMSRWRVSVGGSERMPLIEVAAATALPGMLPISADASAVDFAVATSLFAIVRDAAGPRIFAAAIVAGLLASFLMPLWTLTFATETLGRARESRTLTWILLRPLPRWSVYLAAYLSALPGTLLLNLGGFVAFCLLGGSAGRFALPLFWLPIVLGSLAFAALFQLLSVAFRRAGILGLSYAFFLETIAGNLPGQQKLLSISYYVRCLMVDRAREVGLTLDLGGTRPAVTGAAAIATLLVATALLLVLGAVVFSRKEYVEASTG